MLRVCFKNTRYLGQHSNLFSWEQDTSYFERGLTEKLRKEYWKKSVSLKVIIRRNESDKIGRINQNQNMSINATQKRHKQK